MQTIVRSGYNQQHPNMTHMLARPAWHSNALYCLVFQQHNVGTFLQQYETEASCAEVVSLHIVGLLTTNLVGTVFV